jgi:hypothetical protein
MWLGGIAGKGRGRSVKCKLPCPSLKIHSGMGLETLGENTNLRLGFALLACLLFPGLDSGLVERRLLRLPSPPAVRKARVMFLVAA